MKFFCSFLSIILLTSPGFSPAQETPQQSTLVAGTRVSLTPPAEFTLSAQFPGYQQESTGASIMVTEIPGPFAEVSAGFSVPAELAKKGMTLQTKEEITVDGRTALLLQIWQVAAGKEFLKWILAFGNANETVMVMATFPKQHESDRSEKLRTSLLTVTWDSEKSVSPTEGLSFTLSEKGEMKLAKRMANMLIYTKGGIMPTEGEDVPLFIIGQSISKVNVEDPESLAKLSLLQNDSVADIEIEQPVKVLIDSLSGYEIIAKGMSAKSKQPTVIYQMMLFEDQNYYIMLGMVGSEKREAYLQVFREMAGSFRR
ncbi:MAG: hypothetical protein DYG95_00705 [Chlorobi bacterium CHB1]|nr:hypothetical protein [Chlorobi bacterium CHB1]